MKEKISLEKVSYIAKLADLPFTNQEKKQIGKDLSEVIDFNMNLLGKVETKNVEPTAHVSGITSRMRTDDPEPGLSQSEALSNARETHNGFFKVEAVLGEVDE